MFAYEMALPAVAKGKVSGMNNRLTLVNYNDYRRYMAYTTEELWRNSFIPCTYQVGQCDYEEITDRSYFGRDVEMIGGDLEYWV